MPRNDNLQREKLLSKSFSDLLYLAKGKQSSIDFCRECDISPSMFSRYLNKKNKKSCPIEILKKIAAHADPDSGVTFDILVAANGGNDGISSYDYGTRTNISVNEIIGIITTTLLMQQYIFQCPKDYNTINIMGLKYKPSWTIETTAIDKKNFKKWDFHIWNEYTDIKTEEERFIRQFMIILGARQIISLNFDKITFIFTNKLLYEQLKKKTADLKLDVCVSLLFIDAVSKTIIQEHVINNTESILTVLSSGTHITNPDNTLLLPDDNNIM